MSSVVVASVLIVVIIILVIIIVILFLRNRRPATEPTVAENNNILERVNQLTIENDYLRRVKYADESIFDFIRCINIPQTPKCKEEDDGNYICRSRQIDCNKFKMVLENDPIAVERMRVATNRFREAGKPLNPSELTQPIRSWWFF